jgi:hypothetical protein
VTGQAGKFRGVSQAAGWRKLALGNPEKSR